MGRRASSAVSLRLGLLVCCGALVPSRVGATGGPASALSGLEGPFWLLVGLLLVVFAAASYWTFRRLSRGRDDQWWLLALLLAVTPVAAFGGAVILFFPLLYLLL